MTLLNRLSRIAVHFAETFWQPGNLSLRLSTPSLSCFVCLNLIFVASLSAQTAREKIFPGSEFFEFEGHAAFILRPDAKVSVPPSNKPWVFYAPTLPAYPDTHEEWMHRQFLAAGIAVAGIDMGEAYGSPDSRKVFDRFYEELTEKREMSKRPCLLGRSRGGLWVCNWACDHPDRFAGIAGIYPVYDLRSYPALSKAAPAYGLSESELSSRLNEFNPIARAGVLAKAKLPVYIIHGDEDKVVPLEANSAALASLYRAAGNESAITVNVVKGQGHNFWEGFFQCQELVDFVVKVAKQP